MRFVTCACTNILSQNSTGLISESVKDAPTQLLHLMCAWFRAGSRFLSFTQPGLHAVQKQVCAHWHCIPCVALDESQLLALSRLAHSPPSLPYRAPLWCQAPICPDSELTPPAALVCMYVWIYGWHHHSRKTRVHPSACSWCMYASNIVASGGAFLCNQGERYTHTYACSVATYTKTCTKHAQNTVSWMLAWTAHAKQPLPWTRAFCLQLLAQCRPHSSVQIPYRPRGIPADWFISY